MSDLATYHAWNIAAARFGGSPESLSAEHAERLDAEVARALALEARILESREAIAVALPIARIADAVAGWRDDNPGCAISDAVLFEALHRELRVQAAMDTVGARARPVSEVEVRDFYDANPERFHRPERRAVRHLLVTVNPEFADNTEGAARARIDAYADRLRGGASFAELAQRHSECPTAMKGGEVGTVGRGALYPELEALVFSLPVGGWGGPVRTVLGWHLVACDAIEPEDDVSFDDAEAQIREHLAKIARRAAQVTWLRALAMRPVLVKSDTAAA
jgi:peptidyl-prolyl cis-trans isomerase C